MHQLNFELTYEWVSVLREKNAIYLYPQEISQCMKDNYKYPQIYHWNIFKNTLNDEVSILEKYKFYVLQE